LKYCTCGFSGVEIHFLRLDGGKGLSSDCRACQQRRLGISKAPRNTWQAYEEAKRFIRKDAKSPDEYERRIGLLSVAMGI
jgi:hypothetical protein